MVGQKKDPRLTIPGFEVYAKLKPIVPLWQWFVAVLVLSLFASPYVIGEPPTSSWQVLIFVFLLTGLCLTFAIVLRRKAFPVGIKRVEGTVLMAGKRFSETLSFASKIELTSPSIIRLEKPGGRMALKKMILLFSSSSDAGQVYGWLDRSDLATSVDRDATKADEVWALVYAGEYVKRSRIQFERDICFVVDPGNTIFDVRPKKIRRKDEVTLIVATGFWRAGNIMMRFDSSSDADAIEQRLKQQIEKS